MKVFTDVTSGILQKTSIFAVLADFILEAQSVQLRKAVLWKLFRLWLPEGISLCELQKLLFPPSVMNASVSPFFLKVSAASSDSSRQLS